MTEFLIRKFVKKEEAADIAGLRQSYGIMAGVTGVVCNISLFIIKLIAGLITGHISIVADALNNLSDMGSSVVTLIGFKLAGKPADKDHPFGHGRIEYIAGQIVSFAIIFMGITLIRESVAKIINPEETIFTAVAVVILVISIAVKFWMWHFYRTIGKRIGSVTLSAAATDSLNDCIATSAVLVTMIIEAATGVKLDGFAGTGVAIFVIISGILSCKETMDPLFGKMPEKGTLEEIEKAVRYDNRILGVHDIVVHDYGPGRMYCTLHAEVPSDMSIIQAHEAAHAAENRVANAVGCEITIHIDPVDCNDEVTNELKDFAVKIVKTIDPTLEIHDFHVLKRPPNPKISFDVAVDDDSRKDCDKLAEQIENAIYQWAPEITAEITIDRHFVHSQNFGKYKKGSGDGFVS